MRNWFRVYISVLVIALAISAGRIAAGSGAVGAAFNGALGTSPLDFTEQSAPALSSAGHATFFAKTDHSVYVSINGGAYTALATGASGGTLDAAYDFGGAGAGRTITADSGAVQALSSGADNNNVLEVSKTPAGAQSGNAINATMGANATGVGVNVTLNSNLFAFQVSGTSSRTGGISTGGNAEIDCGTSSDHDFYLIQNNVPRLCFGSGSSNGKNQLTDVTSPFVPTFAYELEVVNKINATTSPANYGIILRDSQGTPRKGAIGLGGANDVDFGTLSNHDCVLMQNSQVRVKMATDGSFQLSPALTLLGSTSGTVTLGVPAVAGATTFTLPGDNGTNGYVLQTNGSGVTSWVAGGAFTGGTITSPVLGANGSAAAPTYSFTSAPTAGMYRLTNDALYIQGPNSTGDGFGVAIYGSGNGSPTSSGIGASILIGADAGFGTNKSGGNCNLFAGSATGSGTNGSVNLKVQSQGLTVITATGLGSALLGGAATQTALTTTATDGFVYVPTCAGSPTGTPAAVTGGSAVVVDSTNHTLRFRDNGVWNIAASETNGRQTAQTAADANVVTVTVGAADASYEISPTINVTATAVGLVGTVTYTDETNTSRSQTLPFVNLAGSTVTTITTTGAYEGVVIRLRCKASTTIVVSTAITSGTYNVECGVRMVK